MVRTSLSLRRTSSNFSRIILALFLVAGSLQWIGITTARASTPVTAGYRDFSYGTSGISTPTAEKPESKLWWNDGYWWGSLYNNVTQAYHIYRLNLATQDWIDTGVMLDDRNYSLADALWDGQHLYIASHIFNTNAQPTTSPNTWGKLYRYSYNSTTKTYSLDTGFPVYVTNGRSEALVLAKDSTGRLWVTYVESSKVMVNHSLSSDTAWAVPYVLPVSATFVSVSNDDISSIIAFKFNNVWNIGVMWGNQKTSKVYFAVHKDSDADTVWQTVQTALPGPNDCSGACADDHLNIKSLHTDGSGRVFAVIKTSLTALNAPLVMVLVRDLNANWSSYVFGRVSDHHTRPMLLIDEQQNRMYVFASTPESGGSIYYKSTDINNISFSQGLGDPFIKSSTDLRINNATSTKQNVNGTTGLVVLASDNQTHYYLHNYLSLGGGSNAPIITSFTPTSGAVGTQVTLTGSKFTGATSAAFNGTPATFTVDSDTQLRATVPGGATSGLISVTTPGGTGSSTTAFTVLGPPVITSFTPTTGPVGTQVTLAGSGFTATSAVTFNGTPATSFTIDSDIQLRATVPSGATTGLIAVTNPYGTTSSTTNFTVTPPSTDIAFQENRTGVASSSSSLSTASSLTAAPGHLYLAAISTRPRVSVNSLSGLGLTWTRLASQCAARNQTGIEVWAAQGSPSANGPVTASLAGTPTSSVISVSRYSGVAAVNPVGNLVAGNTLGVNGACSGGADSAAYSFNLTTTIPKAYAFGAASMRSRTHTPGAGYTERSEVLQGVTGDATSIALEDRLVASATTLAVNGTFSGVVDWAVIALEIKPSSGPPAGITVTPTSGLVTTESGGQATFTVKLDSQPSADVIIGLNTSDDTEGTVSPVSLTFTSANWATPQTVTISGVEDPLVDGNIAYTIVTAPASSSDPNYNTLNAADVSVTNNDNDLPAGITVTPTSGLVTTESGGQATFTVKLDSQPSADVIIGLSTSDDTEGTVSPVSLTFTSADWATPQTVTVSGVEDPDVDGNIAYTIVTAPASSSDPNYNTLNAADVSVTNNDNDLPAGITVTPTSGLVTTESGGQATFTVKLDSQPSADVIIGLSTSDDTEGTVSPVTLTFTSADWSTPQTVTISGVEDPDVDGNVAYTVITAPASSSDPNYNTLNAADVSVTNNDNDSAAAVAFEENRTGVASSSSSLSTATNLTAAPGHLYLAAISTRPRVSVNSLSGLGLTWTRLASQCAARNQTGIEVWAAQGSPSANGPVTASLAGTPTNSVISVSRYSGVAAVNPVGNLVAGNTLGVNGACSGGVDSAAYSFNLTTTIPGAFAFGAASMRQRTHTPGAGYTERSEILQGTGGDVTSIALEDQLVASATTLAVNGTFSGVVDWAVIVLEIRP